MNAPANLTVAPASAATNTHAIQLPPNVTDGTSSVAEDINNGSTLPNAAAVLLRVRNNATTLFSMLLNSSDGVRMQGGCGSSFLSLSTSSAGRFGYGASTYYQAGNAHLVMTDSTGILDLAS